MDVWKSHFDAKKSHFSALEKSQSNAKSHFNALEKAILIQKSHLNATKTILVHKSFAKKLLWNVQPYSKSIQANLLVYFLRFLLHWLYFPNNWQ